MGISIRVSGASFSKYVSKPLLEIRDGLVGEFYFGSQEGDNLRNWADESKPLTSNGVLNTLDWGVSGLSLTSGFYTSLAETANFTVVHVGKTTADFSAQLVGVRANVTTGITAFVGANQQPACYAKDSSGLANFIAFNDSARPFTNESIIIGRSQGDVGTPETKWVDRWVAGERVGATNTNTDNRQLDGVYNWGIGWSPFTSVTTGATTTHRMAAIYDRKLSDTEAQQVAEFLRGYYLDRSVAI